MHRLNVPLMIYAIDVPFDWSANSEIQYTNTSTKMRQMTQAMAMIESGPEGNSRVNGSEQRGGRCGFCFA